MPQGSFVISLDFELFWGVRDSRKIDVYGAQLLAVHQVIPKLLQLFRSYEIKATFSTVGFLFFETKAELLSHLPPRIPQYENPLYSPYVGHFDLVGKDFQADEYHFAPRIIDAIRQYPEQEIGSHTFSHYYCLEPGQTIEDFDADMEMAVAVAAEKNIQLTSLVFPRNQFNDTYLEVCNRHGIICYRGNKYSWIYQGKREGTENRTQRAMRLADAYINISGHNCYSRASLKSKLPIDIPASRFLRPYDRKLKLLERLRLHRIKTGMTHAARNSLVYHLWWHPHNFGANQEENFAFLEKILKHYIMLNKKYNFESISMSQLANEIINDN